MSTRPILVSSVVAGLVWSAPAWAASDPSPWSIGVIASITALAVGGICSLLGLFVDRDEDRPISFAALMATLIVAAITLGMTQTILDEKETIQKQSDLAEMLSTVVEIAVASRDQELADTIHANGGPKFDVAEPPPRWPGDARDDLDAFQLLSPSLLSALEPGGIVALLGVLIAGLAGVLGVWMERDRDAPPRWAYLFSALILVAASVEFTYTVYTERQDDKIENQIAGVLISLNELAVRGHNPALTQFVGTAMAAQSRANPEIADKVEDEIVQRGGSARQLEDLAESARRQAAGLASEPPAPGELPELAAAFAGTSAAEASEDIDAAMQDVAEQTRAAAEQTRAQAQEAAAEAKEQATQAVDDAKEGAKKAKADAKGKAEAEADKARNKANKAKDDAKDKTDDAKDKAKDLFNRR